MLAQDTVDVNFDSFLCLRLEGSFTSLFCSIFSSSELQSDYGLKLMLFFVGKNQQILLDQKQKFDLVE